MVLSAFAFSLMTVFVKLAGKRLPWQELVLARAAVTLVLSYAWLRFAKVPPFGNHRALLIVRGAFGFMGLSSVYYAVPHLPLAPPAGFSPKFAGPPQPVTKPLAPPW